MEICGQVFNNFELVQVWCDHQQCVSTDNLIVRHAINQCVEGGDEQKLGLATESNPFELPQSEFLDGVVVRDPPEVFSGFRLPWPPSCCLNEPTPFVGSR